MCTCSLRPVSILRTLSKLGWVRGRKLVNEEEGLVGTGDTGESLVGLVSLLGWLVGLQVRGRGCSPGLLWYTHLG